MSNPNVEFKNKCRFKEKAESTGLVHGTDGDIEVDLNTGDVLKPHSVSPGFKYWTSRIKRFDLGEYREFYRDYNGKTTSFDILDLGYWAISGRYVPPNKNFRDGTVNARGW